MHWSSRIRSNGQANSGGVAVKVVQSMAVVAVMLLSTALLGEAQARKVGQEIDQGRSSGPVDQVGGAFDGDRISRRDGSGDSGISDRFVIKASATIGGEKYPQRGSPSEMAGSSPVFSALRNSSAATRPDSQSWGDSPCLTTPAIGGGGCPP